MLKSERAKQAKAATILKIDAHLAAKADTEGWDPATDADYQALLATRAAQTGQITAFELAEQDERDAPALPPAKITGGKHRSEDDRARGFGSPREFISAVIENSDVTSRADVADDRLKPLAVADKDDKAAGGKMAFMMPLAWTPRSFNAAVGSDEQGVYDNSYGGFGVTTTRLGGMKSVGFEGDPTAGRTFSVPMQSPKVEIEAKTDKNHTTSVVGGLTVARKAEAAAAAASRAQMELVTLSAASLFGLNYATEELLADSPATFAALVTNGFETQFAAHMLNEKLRGLGGDQFDGVINTAPCTVSVAKESGQAADTIVAANVIKMRARCWGYGSAIWLANQDTFPQLATMSIGVGTAGVLVYQQSLREDLPDTLMGRPIFYTEFASTVGDVGDIVLGSWGEYLEGVYQPLQSAESMHVRFVNHERAIKFWLRNAGAPWWRSALTPAKSTATLSPFVTLQAR